MVEKEEEVYIGGSVTAGYCPRSGHVWLWCEGRSIVIPTTCKSWRCDVCQKTKQWVVRQKAKLGCIRMAESFGRSLLITVTYRRTAVSSPPDAVSVGEDWKALIARWRILYPQIGWMRVPEVTKHGYPHLHVLASWKGLGTLSEKEVACEDEPSYLRSWLKKPCTCLEHKMSRQWYEITKTSWVVDVSITHSPKSAGRYVAKYLTKSSLNWQALENLGFSRRYSVNRGWPVGDTWLLGRLYGWVSRGWSIDDPVGRSMADMTDDDELLMPMGDPLELQEGMEVKTNVALSEVKKLMRSLNHD